MLSEEIEIVWNQILSEVEILIDREPDLTTFYYSCILQHKSFDKALSYVLSKKLSNSFMSSMTIRNIINEIYTDHHEIIKFAIKDIRAIYDLNPTVHYYSTPFLYLKGFYVLQIYRISNFLWYNGKKSLALYFQNQISFLFSVDIHPGSMIGFGVVLDNATGIFIGETSIIGNYVYLAQSVILGSTGKINSLRRHPKLQERVIVEVGAIILGNVEIGFESKIGAGSIVLSSIPPKSTIFNVSNNIVNVNK